jgi:hypothetical protein
MVTMTHLGVLSTVDDCSVTSSGRTTRYMQLGKNDARWRRRDWFPPLNYEIFHRRHVFASDPATLAFVRRRAVLAELIVCKTSDNKRPKREWFAVV